MWRPSEGQFALGGLFLIAIWLWVALPLLYRPTNDLPQQAIENTHVTSVAPSAANPTGGEEGTEFLPPLFGFKLKITDTLLVIFTLGLTIFTGLLWKSTKGLYFVTRIVADADRPHMIPSEMQLSGLSGPSEHGFVRARLTYRFVNYGRSPAFVKRFVFAFRVLAEAQLEPTPAYGAATETDYIIVVNGWWGTTDVHPSTISIDEKDIRDAINGTVKFIIVGYVEYEDIALQKHTMRFAYDLIVQDGKDASVQFRPVGPASYREYT